jgi:uncharacterized protein involved in exopolysaccharide biosynthesis
MQAAQKRAEERQAKMGEAGMRQFDFLSTATKEKSEAASGEFTNLVAMFRRRLWIIMLTTALVFLAVAFYTASATKMYTATAEVQLGMQDRSVMGAIDAAVTGMPPDAAKVDTESQIMSSRTLVARVVDKLNLVDDPEFNKPAKKGLVGSMGELFGRSTVIPAV